MTSLASYGEDSAGPFGNGTANPTPPEPDEEEDPEEDPENQAQGEGQAGGDGGNNQAQGGQPQAGGSSADDGSGYSEWIGGDWNPFNWIIYRPLYGSVKWASQTMRGVPKQELEINHAEKELLAKLETDQNASEEMRRIYEKRREKPVSAYFNDTIQGAETAVAGSYGDAFGYTQAVGTLPITNSVRKELAESAADRAVTEAVKDAAQAAQTTKQLGKEVREATQTARTNAASGFTTGPDSHSNEPFRNPRHTPPSEAIRAAGFDYRKTFFDAHPELKGKVVVHHAVEQQVLTLYPGRFTAEEIHAIENLRGIPRAINPELHLSKIRREWNKFYLNNPNSTRQHIIDEAKRIDDLFGGQFNPPL